MSHAPRWPGLSVPLVLVVLFAAGLLASVAVALIAAALGADDLTPALALLLAVVHLALLLLILREAGARAGIDLQPTHLGFRRVAPRMALVVLGFGVLVAALAAPVTYMFVDLVPERPRELPDPPALIGAEAGTWMLLLARAVIGVIAFEILARGFCLPALVTHIGRRPAIAVVALLSAFSGLAVVPLAAAVLGAVLCVMYLASGSILPGIGLHAAAQGLALGFAFDWKPEEAAALAVVTGAVAFLLVAVPTRSWDRDPRTS